MSYFPSASYAQTASVATSISFVPVTASFATTASYARNTLTASYALTGGTGGGGAYLPLAGVANMTGPFTMSSATDTPLEKIVFNMGVLSQARIGANYDTGVVFSVNAFYAGGGSWIKDDVTAPSFATFEHVSNGQFEWRTSPGDGNPNITWTKPFIIGNNGVAIFPTLLPVGISGSLFVGGTINGVGSGITGIISSSYAATASLLLGSIVSSSYALTASYALNGGGGGGPSVSSSYALTSSYSSYAATAGGVLVNTRTTGSVLTGVLATGSFETGSIALTKGFALYIIQTSRPARVRLYTQAAYRDADKYRGTNVEPTGSHGIISDILTISGSLIVNMAPIPYGASLEAVPSNNIAYTITNNDTALGSVAVTASFLKLE